LVIAVCAREVSCAEIALTKIVPDKNFCRPPWILAWKVVTGTNAPSS
jgi:hypothetical protein